MKKILVPTDFSRDADHALDFACGLSLKLKAEIVLHHSYVSPIYATDLPLAIPSDAELEKNSLDGLGDVRKRYLKKYPALKFNVHASAGYAEDEIPKSAIESSADLIIMGTKGASGLREALIGTITASVFEHSTCPVIAIPELSTKKTIDRIVFATSYEEGDFGNIEQVIDFARVLQAEIILLHITSGKYDRTFEFDAIEKFMESIREDSHFSKISFKLLDGTDVYSSINHYLEEVDADMVAMTIRHRPFMRKLFERSLTKRMAYHTRLPLIVFPGTV